MKICIICNEEKQNNEFYYSCRSDDELSDTCKKCSDPDLVEVNGRIWE